MKKKDKEDLHKLKVSISIASGLRMFPNGRNLPMKESVALNNIGKLLEQLYLIVDVIEKGKMPIKAIKIIRQARIDLEKE